MILDILNSLLNKLGIIVFFAFLLSKTQFFRKNLFKQNISFRSKWVFIILFGLSGIASTYFGIPIDGAIANSRSIAIVVAGLLGGPYVGVGAGLIAGIHRMLIPDGRFTAIACGVSTIVGGILGSLAHNLILDKKNKWLYGMLTGINVEVIQMSLILLISRPFSKALELVKIIFLPMTLINAVGIGIFIFLIYQIYEDEEKSGARKAQLALNIATKTLPYLRKGLNNESAEKATRIIFDMSGVDAVSITNKDTVLSFIGIGNSHHKSNSPISTTLTRKSIEEGRVIVGQKQEEIECSFEDCPLKSVIVVPLKVKDKIAGTLKIYKTKEYGINDTDKVLAEGLAQLFSTQLELSDYEKQKELLAKAEIKALQAQIQPHFLFNALNTITSFCRINPDKARELLINLGHYLRSSFKTEKQFVDIEDEISVIKSYLDIEKARFQERISVEYNIPKNIKLRLPSLILQPLVENAVRHGIFHKDKGGRIIISVEKKRDFYQLTVEDNGKGFNIENFELGSNRQNEGVGLRNVNSRLVSLYGEGIKIESKINKGTKIKFNIPKETKK